MQLTSNELDELTEIQDMHDASEIEAAIAALRPEALTVLRQECLDGAARLSDIASRVERRLQTQA
jgi:hypothetical protein